MNHHVWCMVCGKHDVKELAEYADIYRWMCARCATAYAREQAKSEQEYEQRQRVHEISMSYLVLQVLGLYKEKPRKPTVEIPEDEL